MQKSFFILHYVNVHEKHIKSGTDIREGFLLVVITRYISTKKLLCYECNRKVQASVLVHDDPDKGTNSLTAVISNLLK